MKKPITIYLVGLWVLLQQTFYLGLPLQWFALGAGLSPQQTRILHGLILIGVISVLVALVQLRSKARWFAVAFLGMATLVVSDNAIGNLMLGKTIPFRFAVFALLGTGLNIACIVYLARSRFGSLCRQYRLDVRKKKDEIDVLRIPKL